MSAGLSRRRHPTTTRRHELNLTSPQDDATSPRPFILSLNQESFDNPVFVAGGVVSFSGIATPSTTLISFDAKAIMTSIEEIRSSIADLSDQMQEMKMAIIAAENFCTFITTLGSDEFELRKPIPITVTRRNDDVIAGFLDANISTGGDSPPEAIGDLQSLIIDIFEALDDADDSTLGPEMLRQKRVLAEVVCRIS